MIFKKIQQVDSVQGFEQVVVCQDPRVGLKAIIAMHSTVLGPATGGCRMWNYANEEEAINDVLRLSKGMTYKASLAGLNWGGGKAVIWGDAKTQKSPALLERFGEYVARLGGNYITAKYVGIGGEDLAMIKRKTKHVLGIEGEAGSSGDPSPATAWGTYHGMKACARRAFGSDSLKGKRIALQGLGSVAYYLAEHLAREGAILVGCDVDAAAIDRATKKFGMEIVSTDAIYDVNCDIFSPNALGATINAKTLPRIKAQVIAGAANNQLENPDTDGPAVMKAGKLYAPDYAINAGGLINIYYEGVAEGGYSKQKAFDHVEKIGKTIEEILNRSNETETPSYLVADRMAEERVEKARARLAR